MAATLEVDPLLWIELTAFLAIAVTSHFVTRRLRQPSLVGEIGIGIVVGTLAQVLFPSAALGSGKLFSSEIVAILGSLGAVILLFIVGLESDLKLIYTRKNISVASGGVILPWIGGYFLADLAFGSLFSPRIEGGVCVLYCTEAAAFAAKVFVGSTLVATSVAATASVLHEAGKLRTDTAQTILGAAVVDDVLGMIVLALSQGISSGSISVEGIVILVVEAVAFIVIAVWAGTRYIAPAVTWIQTSGRRLGLQRSGFLLAMALTFTLAFISANLRLSPIIGAFLAGAMLSSSPSRDEIKERAETLGAILVPIFFISIGLFANIFEAADPVLLAFLASLTVVAVLSKFIGCALPARFFGLDRRKSLIVGVGMAPRGEVALIIALFALTNGIVGPRIFTVIVLMAILTTLLPPMFLKRLLDEGDLGLVPPTTPTEPSSSGTEEAPSGR